MATISEISAKIERLNREFDPTIKNTLSQSKELMSALVKDQLMAGMDEEGKPLRPSYLDDPYFKDKAKSDKGARYLAKRYMDWKEQLYPPESTFMLGLRPRDVKTPNLIIIGTYHRSITAVVTKDSIKVESMGFYAGDDIEKKYGKKILGLSKEARSYLIRVKLNPAIAKLFKDVGLK